MGEPFGINDMKSLPVRPATVKAPPYTTHVDDGSLAAVKHELFEAPSSFDFGRSGPVRHAKQALVTLTVAVQSSASQRFHVDQAEHFRVIAPVTEQWSKWHTLRVVLLTK
jgi:hypothetical protein